MKAGYPFRKYTRALKLASMMLILWGLWFQVQSERVCYYPGDANLAYAQEVIDSPSLIKSVEVTQQEQDSLVTITGSKPLTYTVVKLSDPMRILVDVPGFTTAQDMDPIQVDSNAINEITTKPIEKGERKFCRIEIALKKDVEYDVSAKESDLLIRIAPSASTRQVETAGVVQRKKEDNAVQPLKVATITNLEITEDPPLVTIFADSMLDSYKAFQLDDPSRMVVDIPGVREELKEKLYTTDSPLLEKVKVGQHHDKVRFVLYFKDKLPPYKIDKNDTKLYVRLSSSADEMMTVAKNGNDKTPTVAKDRLVVSQEEKVYTGQKISLDFKDADIQNILRLIADVSGLNIIVSDSVAGKVTIKLDNVPWDEVLDIILETNNLGKIWTKSVMRIETQDQIRKISDDQYRAQKSLEKVADLETVVVDIIYRDATDIHNLLSEEKELTSARGALTVDPNLNRIVVTDTPDKIETIRKRIARYDDTTVRQVFIDAKIVQSIPTHTKEIGIQWGGPYSTTGDGGDTIYGVAGSSGVEFERETVTDPITGLATEMVSVIGGNVIDLPAAVGLGAGGGIGFGILRDNLELTATLTAMEKDEKLKIISSPRVMSIDKNEAMIKQGVALPYLKLSEEGVTSTEFKDAVLELKVTPTILSEKIIKIEIRVKKDQKSAQTGAGGEPGIDVREAQTVLMVESGRTVVIGGIYEEGTQTIMSGVPFFSGIPGIGRLFRNDYSKKELTELLIFVTTTIVPKDIVGSDV